MDKKVRTLKKLRLKIISIVNQRRFNIGEVEIRIYEFINRESWYTNRMLPLKIKLVLNYTLLHYK
jgi:hypothetical protein